VYYTVLGGAEQRPGPAIFTALLSGAGFVLVALALAVLDLVRAGGRRVSAHPVAEAFGE